MPDARLKISVIVSTHARPASLNKLIETLAPQIRASERELLIAENGTESPISLRADFPVAAHLHQQRPGKCRTQNQAIERAGGEILVFLDDDLTVSSDYLDQVATFFINCPQFAAMKGRVLPAEDPKAKAGKDARYLDLPIVDHGDAVMEVRGVIGANMAFRAEALKTVGLFDERLGPGACGHEEETEMSARLTRAGFRIGYAPLAVAFHEVDVSRANRDRFLRIARERGRCRVIHEKHSRVELSIDFLIARTRLSLASAFGANLERIAREEKRLATVEGMLDGLSD